MSEEANPYTQYLEQPEPAPDNPRAGNPFLAPTDSNPFEQTGFGEGTNSYVAKSDNIDRFSSLLGAMSISERAKSFDTATDEGRMYRLNRDDTPIGSLNGPQRLVARANQSGEIAGISSDAPMSFNAAAPAYGLNDGTTSTVSEQLPWVYGVFGDGWGILTPEERMAEVKTRRTETLEKIGLYRKYLGQAQRAVDGLSDDQGSSEYGYAVGMRDDAKKKLADYDKELKRYDLIEKDPRMPGLGLNKTMARSAVENTSRAVLDTAISSVVKFAGIGAGLSGKQFGLDVSEDDNAIYEAGKSIATMAEQMFPGDVARQQDFSQKLAQGAGSMAAFMGTGALGFALAGPEAGLVLLAASGGIAQGTQEFDQASQAILAAKRKAEDTYGPIQFTPTEKDRLIATGWGFLLGLSEAVPFVGTSKAAGLRGAAGNAGRQSIEEALQEGGQTLGTNIGAKFTYDPNRDIGEGVGEGAAVGFVLGGMVGGLTGYRSAVPDAVQPSVTPDAQSVPTGGGIERPPGMVAPQGEAVPAGQDEAAASGPIAGPSDAEVEQAVELWRTAQAVEPATEVAEDVGADAVDQAEGTATTAQSLIERLPEDIAQPVAQAVASIEQQSPGAVDAIVEQIAPQAAQAQTATAEMRAELERLGIAQATTEDEVRQILSRRAQPQQQAPAPANPAIAKLTSYLDGGGSLAKSQYPVAARALGVRESELTALLDQAVTSGTLRKVGNRYRRTPSAAPRTPQAVKQTVDEVIKKLAPVIPKGTTVKSFAELKDLPASARARLGQASDGVVDPASGNRVDAFEQDGTIYLAQYALNKEGRITHEVMHALVTKGLLSPAEVGLLANRARKAGLFTKETEAQYRAAYAGRANLDALVDEEAAAALVESRADGASYGQKLDTIMDRILAFFKQLGQMLRRRGYRTADEVLDGFFSGEIAQRRAVQEWMRANVFGTHFGDDVRFAIRQDDKTGKRYIEAYHGSPHNFDSFDISKIGTGEGAQAYGYGLYFADSEGVAKSYRDALSSGVGINKKLGHLTIGGRRQDEMTRQESLAASAYNIAKGDADRAITWTKSDQAQYENELKTTVDAARRAELQSIIDQKSAVIAYLESMRGQPISRTPRGRFYQVRINADPDDFLDWDKPLSQQSEKVRAAIGDDAIRYSQETFNSPDSIPSLLRAIVALKTGIERPVDEIGDAASRLLSQAGIPGIKYLDQGSRSVGEGSRNYVVFDDKIIEITHKDGKPVTAKEKADAVAQLNPEATRNSPNLMFALSDLADRNNAVLLDDITKDQPHPGRVLALHGTRATFDRFSTQQSADGFLHFGTLEQSERFAQQDGSQIPLILDLKRPVDVPDLMTWSAIDIAEAVEAVEPNARGLTERVREFVASQPKVYDPKFERDRVSPETVAAAKQMVTAELDALGIDSLRYWNEAEGEGWSYLVWKPQGKVTSATTGNVMFALRTGDQETGRSMRRDLDALGYYSAALEAAKGLKQAKGTPEQMLQQILQTPGVKAGEIEATGLKNALEGKKSVTRDEIVQFLEQNRVKLNEVVAQPWKIPDRIGDKDPYIRAMEAAGIRDTRWSSHSLDPKNPTYRETVLHLPAVKDQLPFDEYLRRYRQEVPNGRATDADVRSFWESGEPLNSQYRQNPPFQSGHFPEPNITGHMMTSMTKHEGRPVYTIDQIQSDWGQKLRDGGVRNEAKIDDLFKQARAAREQWQQSKTYANSAEIRADPNAPAFLDAVAKEKASEAEYNRLTAELAVARSAATGHPLVNTTDQWVNTTLRRALTQAVEADAEYIAIPHGDTVLSYNPGKDEGMQGFYGTRNSEGIVPKNLRKILEKFDKEAAKPIKTTELETSSGTRGYRSDTGNAFDKAQTGFTLFPLTDTVKQAVRDQGLPMFALSRPQGQEMGRSMRRDLDGLGYYSKALRAANELKQAKGTPEQMLAQLKSAGVKQAEIDATGLTEFLGGKAAVTKDEIIRHLTENKTRINETEYSANSGWSDELERLTTFVPARQSYSKALDNDRIVEKMRRFAEEQGEGDSFLLLLDGDGNESGWKLIEGEVPVWSDSDGYGFILTAPTGKVFAGFEHGSVEEFASAAEVVREWKERAADTASEMRLEDDFNNNQSPGQYTKWSDYSLDPSNPSYRETVLHLPVIEQNQQWISLSKQIEDIGTRQTELGKQFYTADSARRAELDRLNDELIDQKTALADQRYELEKRLRDEQFNSGHFPEPNIVGHMMTSMVKHEGRPVYLIDQIQSDWGQKLRDGGVRDEAKIAQLQSDLRASEEAMTTAWSEAYSQGIEFPSGKVDDVEQVWLLPREVQQRFPKIIEASNATKLLRAELKTARESASGHPLVNTTDQWTTTTLRRAIRQAAEADADYIAIPSGDTVLSYNPGDTEGMRGFYDKIVPKNLRNILEKIDKASPAPLRVNQLETPTQGMKGEGFTVFPLTDKVKASVRDEGQPMFALSDGGSLQSIATDLARDLDLVVRPGLSKTAAGRAAKRSGLSSLYEPATGVIRVQSVTDIQALGEASADALRARFGQPMQDLLAAQAAELVPGVPTPTDAAINSAFRSWFRDYLISPSLAEANAPTLFDEVEAFLDAQDPTLVAKLNSTQDAIQAYYQADPARFMEGVVRDATKPGLWAYWNEQRQLFGVRGALSIALNQLYTATIAGKDQPFATAVWEALRIYERNTGSRIDIAAAENAAKLIRLAPHSHAWAARDMEDGVKPYGGITPRGPGLIDALVMALGTDRAAARDVGPGSNYRKFGSYLVAKYAAVEWARFRDGTKPAAPTVMPPGAATADQAIAFYERVAQTYEAANPEFATAANLVYDFQQELLTLQKDAGFISQETFDELIKDRTYVPFYRAFDEDGDLSSRALGSGPNGLLKRKRGSERDIIDPIAGIAQKVFETRQAIALNDVKKQLLRVAEQAGPGGGVIAERVEAKELKGQNIDLEQAIESAARDAGIDPRDKAQMIDVMRQVLGNDALATYYTQRVITPGREPIVFFFEGGAPQAMRLGDGEHGHRLAAQMFEVLNTFGKAHLDMIVEIAALPAQTTRLGITTHPEFAAANLVRDALMAFQYDPKATPLYTQLKGIVDVARGAEYVRGFYRTGGMMGGEGTSYADKFRMERDIRALVARGYTFKLFDTLPNLLNHVSELVEVRNWRDRAAGGIVGAVAGAAVTGPVGAVVGGFVGATAGAKALVKLGEISETATRARLWKHGFDRAIEQGLDPVAAGQEAAFWAHDYTDYSRRGSRMDGLAAVIPFLNANLQGNDVYIRRLLGKGDQAYNPGVLFPLYRAGILDATRLTPRQQQELGLSAWTWSMTVMGLGTASAIIAMMWDDDERLKDIDDQVKASHWLIPVGDTIYRVPKPFQTVWFSQMIERWITEGRKNNPRWFEHYLEDLWSTWKPPIVPAAAEVVGTMTGYDISSGRPIMPAWNQDKSVGQQYDAYTSPFAKWAGPQMSVSPFYVDHVIHKFGATWGRTFTSLNVPGTAWYDPKKPIKGPEEEFISRRFLWQVGRGSEAGQAIREMMGGDKPLKIISGLLSAPYSKYATSATDYRALMEKPVPDHAGAVARLEAMTAKERGFALLEGHFRGQGEIKYRLLHPMNRAERVARETMKIEKEIISNELLTGKKGKNQKEVPLSPSEKKAARDILTQYRMMEMHNALVLTEETGWAGKMLFNTKSVLAELKAASPATYKEMTARFDKAGVLSGEGIAAAWPKFKEKLEDPKWIERVRKNRLSGTKGLFEADYQRARSGRGASVTSAPATQELAPVD